MSTSDVQVVFRPLLVVVVAAFSAEATGDVADALRFAAPLVLSATSLCAVVCCRSTMRVSIFATPSAAPTLTEQSEACIDGIREAEEGTKTYNYLKYRRPGHRLSEAPWAGIQFSSQENLLLFA